MYKEKGFTLIELLIVIVIIGILAGVLISVINPAQQTNRARDAGVQAAINKVALGTEGFVSAYGHTPDGDQFIGALQNATEVGVTCAAAGLTCQFDVTGNVLPVTCSNNGWSGTGTDQCHYQYEVIGADATTSTSFNVYAKSFGIAATVFKYTNTLGTIAQCAVGTENAGAAGCL
jgi:prepilin-type N-terminal cleavage/methylation domain-containing protein